MFVFLTTTFQGRACKLRIHNSNRILKYKCGKGEIFKGCIQGDAKKKGSTVDFDILSKVDMYFVSLSTTKVQ